MYAKEPPQMGRLFGVYARSPILNQGEKMKRLRTGGLAAVAVMALMAFAAAGTALATTYEVGGVAQSNSISIVASLEGGTSLVIKDNLGVQTDTCTTSTIEGKTDGVFTGAGVNALLSQFALANVRIPRPPSKRAD